MGRSYLGYRENISTCLHARSRLVMKNMKSYIAFIWDEKIFRVTRSRLLIGEISVTEIIFVPCEHNFPA